MSELDKSKNHVLYENLTWVYELLFRPFFIGAIRKAMDIIADIAPDSVLEVGVGTGYALEYYPPGTSVVGIDVSDEMVRASRKRARRIEDKNIEIYNTSELAPEILKESVSVVVSFSVITVVDNPQSFINELKEYCEPGGQIILIMHMRGKGFSGFIDRRMDGLMQKLFGFTLLRRISDYNLDGLQIIESRAISHFLFYPYNHLVVLKKL